MLDLKYVRQESTKVREGIIKKNESPEIVDKILDLDKKRREIIVKYENLKSHQNKISKEIGKKKAQGEDISQIIKEIESISKEIKELEEKKREVEKEINFLLYRIPNIPAEEVPLGKDNKGNIVVREWGEKPNFDFTPRPHWEVGKIKDGLDFERGAKLGGSGFVLYKDWAAKLQRALIEFMLDIHRNKGYIEVYPPFLVKRNIMEGTGQLPKFEEDMYKCEADDLFLIPTAEVPVTNIFRDEVLKEEDLPIYFVSYTPCFRREAGSYGRQTRGMVRVHQFDKVELVKFVKPQDSMDELEKLVKDAEYILQQLNLHYRVVLLCTGDLSFAACKCYDIEIWAPGIQQYLEVSSCSNFRDFQARRCNIKYRKKSTGKLEFVHTLNGSGVALPRLFISLIETYQQKDGSILIPPALRKYMGEEIIR